MGLHNKVISLSGYILQYFQGGKTCSSSDKSIVQKEEREKLSSEPKGAGMSRKSILLLFYNRILIEVSLYFAVVVKAVS